MIMLQKKKKPGMTRVVLLFLFALLILSPLYALLQASLRDSKDLMRFGITFQTLIPGNWDAGNYIYLFTGKKVLYPYWLKNSIIITFAQAAVSCFLSGMVGYGLAVYRFRGRAVILSLVLFLLLVPIQILILPLYKLMIGLKTMDTIAGVVLPFAVSPFAVFFFYQYAKDLPKDFINAGRIDGLNEWGIYFRIMAPIMKPAFGAMVIFQSLQAWNSYLWPLIVLRSGRHFTIPIGLNSLLTPYGNNYDVLIAGAVLATVPIIIVFLFFQKSFISGLTSGGIKG
jgi:arabinosaccharide transport system permease protein